MTPSSNRDRNDTQLKVLNEAFVLFGQRGYDGMSMKDLAQRAGITKAALYWHYESKDELFLACIQKITELIKDHTHIPLHQTDLPPSIRVITLVAGVRALLSHPDILKGVAGYWLRPADSHVDSVWDYVRGFRKTSFELLEKTLKEGKASGEFEFDMPVEDLARTVHYTIEANLIPVAFFADQLAVETHAALVLDSFMKAYSPEHNGLGRSIDDIDALLDRAWRHHLQKNSCPSYEPLVAESPSAPAAETNR